MIHGFAPIALADARVLVLGTVPSRRSLEAGEYYAHTRNAFWPIMERLFAGDAGVHGARPGPARLDYAARTALLLEAKVALWDVLCTAERPGSLDADISAPVANDFPAFFERHPAVRTVCFNGTKARALWDRHVVPTLSAGLDARTVAPTPPGGLGLRLVTLPSTSPANAALTFDNKLAAWQVVRDAVGEG